MGVKSFKENNATPKYNFQRKAGRSIIDCRPVFSPDGESVLVIVENVVRVYNIQTGDCARILEPESHVSTFVAIQFPEDDSYSLCGCSDTGLVVTWTWENGAVLRETNLQLTSNFHIVSFNLLDSNECFIIGAKSGNKLVFPALYNVKTGQLINHFEEIKSWYYENLMSVAIGWCNGDRFAAITNGTSRVCIQNLKKPHLSQYIINSNNVRILSVATHRTENALAVVDAMGRTTIFRGNFYEHATKLGREIMHWHFLPAMAVCFSTQGSYLYSGGMEKVLVKWTMGHLANRASEKAFIPRLPGMIRHIATCNSYVAATLTNNSIVIANAQMRVVSTVLECGGLSAAARALGFPLLHHQRLGGLLLGGRPGHLQLYSTTTDKVLFNLDITGLNNTPPLRHNLIPLETEVTCAAVSANGSWLVTSEYRNDGVTYPEERLKFWVCYIKQTTPFSLNTCVNLSHGGCKVVSIALSDRAAICVSAGTDQKFRIWKRESTTQQHRKKESWVCLTACYYSSGVAQSLAHGILNNYKNGEIPPDDKKHPYVTQIFDKNDIIKKLMNIRNENVLDESVVDAGMKTDGDYEMGEVAISQDGSLIAAWFGCKLTLWDTHLCNIRTALSHPMLRPKGLHVRFGNKDAAHYVVCSSAECVAVWSVLSLTVKWLVPVRATCLAADPLSNKMALATTNNDVYVFTPHSSQPILTHKRVSDPKAGVFKQCVFGDCSGDIIRLYLVKNDSEIYALEPEKSDSGELEMISRCNLPPSNFGALLAERQLSAVHPAARAAPAVPAGRRDDITALTSSALTQFLSAAPHMVPPVSLLCTPFLHHISGHQTIDLEDDIGEEQTEIVDTSSEEEVEDKISAPNGPYPPKPPLLWAPNYEMIKEKRLQKIIKEPLLDLHATTDVFGV